MSERCDRKDSKTSAPSFRLLQSTKMGFELPSPTSRAKELIARKQDIESELESQIEILKTNDSTLSSPLLDPNGFPRADIDIWAVRHARVKIIELRNDLKDVMDSIAKALEGIYVPPPPPEEAEVVPEARGDSEPVLTPFAKVNAVAPGSPAASAASIQCVSILTLR